VTKENSQPITSTPEIEKEENLEVSDENKIEEPPLVEQNEE